MLITAWLLVVSSSFYSGMVSYSPPLESYQECQRVYDQLPLYNKTRSDRQNAVCIQVKMYVGGK